ncbi:FAD-binding domain-containing protein [Mycena vulgaris]|nr:FAD-binding domain-containing protein [Mycena vulgaris]
MDLLFGLLLLALSGASSTQIGGISSQQWRALNSTVGGRLRVATPFALPCFSLYNNHSVSPDAEECSVIQANYSSPNFRLEKFSANMNVEYETCMSTGSRCLLDSTNPRNPLATDGISCDQGEIPPYSIDIQVPGDIKAAFKFSKETHVPLSIKNTGQDYMGRSRRRDSLGLWTHNLQTMVYKPQFVADSCSSSHRAVTIGAGVTFKQVYNFADENDAMFIGGYAQTIGASGGWMMGEGHSILSPTFGLGVDRVLEIKIVTPDGELRTANACQNTDLFWALRGGGGGTFGVVIESTHLVEQRIPIQVINMTFTPTSTNLREYYEILVNNSANWGELGWATASMAQISAFAHANNGTATIRTLPSWLTFFEDFIVRVKVAVGNSIALGTRLMPKALFETPSGLEALVAQLLNIANTRGMPYIPVGTPVAFNFTPDATSVTPAWCSTLWELGSGATWAYKSSVEDILSALSGSHAVVEELRVLAPDSGAYMNEGDIYETDHEFTYWGDNYLRLLAIKNKYDPLGLLDCWRCVGWKGPAEFPCYPSL